MPIFARLSAVSDIAEHVVELKDPDKSPTGNCSKRASALAFLVCQLLLHHSLGEGQAR